MRIFFVSTSPFVLRERLLNQSGELASARHNTSSLLGGSIHWKVRAEFWHAPGCTLKPFALSERLKGWGESRRSSVGIGTQPTRYILCVKSTSCADIQDVLLIASLSGAAKKEARGEIVGETACDAAARDCTSLYRTDNGARVRIQAGHLLQIALSTPKAKQKE